MNQAALAKLATLHDHDRFAGDREAFSDVIRGALAGRRVLVLGGAGSIGSATLRALLPFEPATVHVADPSENNLVEVVRDLRGQGARLPAEFRTLPLDYGSPAMKRLLIECGPYDVILNFAALKHVRSEKDVYSLLQLLDTNLLKQARFLGWLRGSGMSGRYFSVSTDKAANPVNFMGASKRVMEHLLFSESFGPTGRFVTTSARFANVAFSDGSLLHGWLRRLEKRQPLAVPENTRRYFVSLEESGSICLLAALAAPDRHLLVPRLEAEVDLVDLQEVAEAFLRAYGFEPALYRDEAAARAAVEMEVARGRYSLLVTPLDTSGEKAFEEFTGVGEAIVEMGARGLQAVPWLPVPEADLTHALAKLEALFDDPARPVSKADLEALLAPVVPGFRHVETGRQLDQRM